MRRMVVMSALAAVIAVPLALGQNAAPAGAPLIALWAADEGTKIDPTGRPLVLKELPGYQEKNAVWDGSMVTLSGARNEYAAFQLLVEGGEEGLTGVTVTPSDLKAGEAVIPAAHYALFREFYTTVTKPSKSPMYSMGPGDYPDALIPMSLAGQGAFEVKAGATQAVWVDVRVPKDAPAGKYEGVLTVRAEGRAPKSIPVNLTVWDFTLPAESHLRWRIGYTDFFSSGNGVAHSRKTGEVSQEFLDLELKFYRMCRAHRVTPTTHYTSPLPDATGTGESMEIDWASYDRRFGAYLDGTAFEDGVPVNIFSLPVNCHSKGGWPSGIARRGKPDIVSFKRAMELTAAHWREKGWDLGDTFVYIADEPSDQSYPLITEHCRVAKEAAPESHRSVALYKVFGTNGPEVVKRLRGYVSSWDIAGDYMLRSALDEVQKDGDWVGIYQGSEPFEGGEALDMDGVALTTWPWIAWLYDLDTLFIYSATEWGTEDIWTDPVNHGWGTNSQGVLVYPGLKAGVKETLPSFRLKAMRRGMQDYEYFWLLREKGKGDLADQIAKRIIKAALDEAATPMGEEFFGPGKWERDAAAWAAARKEMSEAIAAE